jgi:hexosaminidase
MVKKSVLFAVLMSLSGAMFAQIDSLPYRIIPSVQKWAPAKGILVITDDSRICIDKKDYKSISRTIELFRDELKTCTGLNLAISTDKPSKGDIAFAYTTNKNLGNEGYLIDIKKKIQISAANNSGIFYGTRSIIQMLMATTGKNTLPTGLITDLPTYKVRAMLIDVGRKFFPIEVLKDYIRQLAWMKMNEIHFHLSDEAFGGHGYFRIESETFPELTAKDGFYTKAEIRDLIAFAHLYGITITPEIDSPGHARCFTQLRPDLAHPIGDAYLDINKKDVYKLMEQIFDEFIPLFDAPDFHIGTDEYRIGAIKDTVERQATGELFRKYINYFNKYITAKGKNVRIWSGYEFMPGKTEPDKNVIIDMWETDDAKSKSDAGYSMINSGHGYTYIVPGAGYYGVNNDFIYNKWTPLFFNAKKPENNLNPGDPHLLGGKFHLWNDLGPFGYTMNEIARLTLPTMWVFSEKLWGTKGSANYTAYKKRIAAVEKIPNVSVLERGMLSDKNGLMYANNGTPIKFRSANEFKKLSWQAPKDYIEYPWTASFEVSMTDTARRSVLLGSTYAEIYANLVIKKELDKPKRDTIVMGVGIARANHYSDIPLKPFIYDRSAFVFPYQLPKNETVKLTFVGEQNRTTLYVNGKKAGTAYLQMLCPLNSIGNTKGESLKGELKNLKIYNRALTEEEIGL